MEDFTIVVNDYQKFGELIRAWAADRSTIPVTVKDFRDQVSNGKIVTLGKGFKDGDLIQLLEPKLRTVSLIVPDVKDLAPLPANVPYDLPVFYEEAFHAEPDIPEDEKENFRSKRIADYAMRKCV